MRLSSRSVRATTLVALAVGSLVCAGDARAQTSEDASLPSIVTGSKVSASLLTPGDGLSASTPTDILQDSRGFIWIATTEGLNRYDGKEFVVYQFDPLDPTSLSSSSVAEIHEGPEGNIWMNAGGVLNELDPIRGTVVRHKTDPDSRDALPGPIAGGNEAFLNASDGSLLIFTTGGLARKVPGRSGFEVFRHDSTDTASLAHDVVYAVKESPEGILWVITRGNEQSGLNQIRLSDGRVSRLPELMESGDSLGTYSLVSWTAGVPTYSWIVDSQDRFWIGINDIDSARGAVLRFMPDSGVFRRYDTGPSISGESVTATQTFTNMPGDFIEADDGRLLISIYNRGLSEYDTAADRFNLREFDLPDGVQDALFFSPVHDAEGALLGTLIWTGSTSGDRQVDIARVDPLSGELTILAPDRADPKRPEAPSTTTLSQVVDPAGGVWLQDLSGEVTRYDPADGIFKSFSEADGPGFAGGIRGANTWLADRTGGFWLGQANRGLLRVGVEEQPFDLISTRLPGNPLNLDARFIIAMRVTRDGTFWVGSTEGLHRWDPTTSRFRLFRDGYRTDRNIFGDIEVRAIEERADGDLLLGTNVGLFTLDPSDPTFEPFALNGIETVFPVSVLEIEPRSDGSWLTATSRGLYMVGADGEIIERFLVDPATRSDGVGTSTRDAEEFGPNDVWVGLNSGLARLDSTSGHLSPIPASETGGFDLGAVIMLARDRRDPDILWVGTNGSGLVKFSRSDGFKAMYVESNSGMPNNVVYSILQDAEGSLWMGTNRGLVRFSPDDESFDVFGLDDGLQDLEFNQRAAYEAPDGTFMFAGIGGINLFRPSSLVTSGVPPTIAMSRLTIYDAGADRLREYFGVDEDDPGMTSLSHSENDVTFSFAAMDFEHPDANRYMVRLEGYEPSFTDPSTTSAVRYSNLPPGNYTFRVEASNSDGIWTEDGYAFAFTIRPPWWRTIWAYIGYVLLLGAGVWTVDRTQRARIERKERETVRIERAELEAKAAASEAAALKAENELKETELKKAKELEYAFNALQEAHDDLKATQDQLIHAEKMASLGALTAGIAHEIKNPLNFINNFAEINAELADDILARMPDSPEADELRALLADLRQNSDVIGKHGKRADSIVQNMLQHARGGAGEKEEVDINRMVGEYIDLAYHGKRSQVDGFNVDIDRDLGDGVGSVQVVPQDIGRVLLNLIGNAFDAVEERSRAEDMFEPRVNVTTRAADGAVQIRVSDNGGGIAPQHLDDIFKPFFTTKPTGSGTGLGLSMSYDTVTKGHGGTLTVESEPGEGATFTVTLPR